MAEPLLVRWNGNTAALDRLLGQPYEIVAPGTKPSGYQVVNAVWPHIRGDEDGSGFTSGPTGEPWIDANGWKIRVARVVNPEARIWMGYEFPKNSVIGPERYVMAVAEAAAYGADWVVSPDPKLLQDSLAEKPAAVAVWKQMRTARDFFGAHPEWKTYRELSRVVLVSDFAIPERILAMETVNMAARKQFTTRLMKPAAVSPATLGDAAVVLWMDRKPVPEPLVDFVRGGGMIFVNSMVPPLSGTNVADDSHPRFQIRSLGKGKVAASRKPWTDPFLVSGDAQLLASKRTEILKLWNAGAMIASASASPDGQRAVVGIVNYTGRAAGHPVSLRLDRKFTSARFSTFEKPEPVTLTVSSSGDGTEVGLPPFNVYGAVEFGV